MVVVVGVFEVNGRISRSRLRTDKIESHPKGRGSSVFSTTSRKRRKGLRSPRDS